MFHNHLFIILKMSSIKIRNKRKGFFLEYIWEMSYYFQDGGGGGRI